MKTYLLLALNLIGALCLLSACGKQQSASNPVASVQPVAHSNVDSEGQPIVETAETLGPDFDDKETLPPLPESAEALTINDAIVDAGAKAGYVLPDFQKSWGMNRSVYDRAVTYMDMNQQKFANQRYVVVVDMNLHSSKKRMFLFDLQTGKMEMHNVAHGSGSDPRATGYAKFFSNQDDSQKTSLGAYKTAGTYQGKHGLHLRLVGLEKTNSNAFPRGIVIHGANYVSDSGHAGRSWGCPALDPNVVKGVINRVKGGAMVLIWK